MPWKTVKGHGCTGSKPWAVIKSDTGKKVSCHATQADAKKHVAALYANEHSKSIDLLERFGVEMNQNSRPDLGLCLRAVEFRATGDVGDGRTLEGYAAVFGTPTRIQSWEGEFDEEIVAGAFRKTLRSRQPVLQFDHGRDQRTGTVPIGSIDELAEDQQGLFVRARLFDNPVVEPIRQAIEGQAVSGMSFRFQVKREQWTDRDGAKIKDDELPRLLWEPGDRGPLKRSILEVDPLYELGPVVFPAYDSTSVGVRSLLEQLTPDEHRAMLRELAVDLRRMQGETLADLIQQGSTLVDLTVPGARSAETEETGMQPGNGERPTVPTRSRVDSDALRLRGIL